MKTKHGRGNLVNPSWMREAQKLNGRSSRDGRDRSYQYDEYDRRFDQRTGNEHAPGQNYPGMRKGLVDERELADMYNTREQHRRHTWDEEEEEPERGYSPSEYEEDVRAEMEYRSRSSKREDTGPSGRGAGPMNERERWPNAGLRNSRRDRTLNSDRRFRNSGQDRND